MRIPQNTLALLLITSFIILGIVGFIVAKRMANPQTAKMMRAFGGVGVALGVLGISTIAWRSDW